MIHYVIYYYFMISLRTSNNKSSYRRISEIHGYTAMFYNPETYSTFAKLNSTNKTVLLHYGKMSFKLQRFVEYVKILN